MKSKWNKRFKNGKLEIILENDQSTKIVKNSNGYYLICEANDTMSEDMNVGFLYDTVDNAIITAEKKLQEIKIKQKNSALIALVNFVRKVEKSDKDFCPETLSFLRSGLTLPSNAIPQYVANHFTDNMIYKLHSSCDEKLYEEFCKMFQDIVSTDPKTQSAINSVTNLDGRKVMIEKLVGIKAINEKGHLAFKKNTDDHKIFETLEACNGKQEIPCNGITISISDYNTDCTIDLIFVCGRPYIILNDRNNDFHDVIDGGKNVLRNLNNDYGINILECLNGSASLKKRIYEAFGDEGEDGFTLPGVGDTDGGGDAGNDDSPFGSGGDDGDDEGDDEVNEIIEDVDPEIQKEIEIIESNIQKIEDLPDDIRENESIQEIYLLLLGKKESIQKQHDDEKSNEIIENIIGDIESELGDLDNVFKQDNSDSNEIKVEEGKIIECGNGILIKPLISNTFGNKEKFLVVESNGQKNKYKINNSRSIRSILENFDLIKVSDSTYEIEKEFNNAEELFNAILDDQDWFFDEIVDLPSDTMLVSTVTKAEVLLQEILEIYGVGN